jgi:hypothetical protein
MTPDLTRLRAARKSLQAVLDNIELELVDDPQWDEPSDTSYLKEKDRKNPDTMANVEAMSATNRLIAWFGKDDIGYVGLWRGESNRPLTEAPVVRLDTEGQYDIVAATVPDYIAISVSKRDFDATREALVKAGFEVAGDRDAVWAKLEAFHDDPNEFRDALYRKNKTAR